MNMSHCRWNNTTYALLDCDEDLSARVSGIADDQLSEGELDAACRMMAIAQRMLGAIREAADKFGEADLTREEIRAALEKIEAGARRYEHDED
jgi:hypothetical protein